MQLVPDPTCADVSALRERGLWRGDGPVVGGEASVAVYEICDGLQNRAGDGLLDDLHGAAGVHLGGGRRGDRGCCLGGEVGRPSGRLIPVVLVRIVVGGGGGDRERRLGGNVGGHLDRGVIPCRSPMVLIRHLVDVLSLVIIGERTVGTTRPGWLTSGTTNDAVDTSATEDLQAVHADVTFNARHWGT